MADITDPEVLSFVESVIRPIAEKLKVVDDNQQTAIAAWDAGVSTNAALVAAADSDTIIDQNSSTRPVTKLDLTNFITLLQNIDTTMAVAGKRAVNLVPVVRLL